MKPYIQKSGFFFTLLLLLSSNTQSQYGGETGNRPPLVGPDKIEAQKRSWSFLVPLPKFEKSTILISENNKNVELQVIFKNPNFVYEIWEKDSTTIEIRLLYHHSGISQPIQSHDVVLPQEFNLVVLFNDDTAKVHIDCHADSLQITPIRNSDFVEFQRIHNWDRPTWCLAWNNHGYKDNLAHILKQLDSLGVLSILEPGWYQGIPFPVENNSLTLSRKKRLHYNCPVQQPEYVLVFFSPYASTNMPNIVKELKTGILGNNNTFTCFILKD